MTLVFIIFIGYSGPKSSIYFSRYLTENFGAEIRVRNNKWVIVLIIISKSFSFELLSSLHEMRSKIRVRFSSDERFTRIFRSWMWPRRVCILIWPLYSRLFEENTKNKIWNKSLGILGSIALAFLVAKRYLEPAIFRRSWIVWSLDTSKQVVGMLFIHLINIVWPYIASNEAVIDACSLYLFSFLLDSSIGLCIIYGLLRLQTLVSEKHGIHSLQAGQYGNYEYRLRYMLLPWFIQTSLYLLFSGWLGE